MFFFFIGPNTFVQCYVVVSFSQIVFVDTFSTSQTLEKVNAVFWSLRGYWELLFYFIFFNIPHIALCYKR